MQCTHAICWKSYGHARTHGGCRWRNTAYITQSHQGVVVYVHTWGHVGKELKPQPLTVRCGATTHTPPSVTHKTHECEAQSRAVHGSLPEHHQQQQLGVRGCYARHSPHTEAHTRDGECQRNALTEGSTASAATTEAAELWVQRYKRLLQQLLLLWCHAAVTDPHRRLCAFMPVCVSLDEQVVHQQQHHCKAPNEGQHLLVLLVAHHLHTTAPAAAVAAV